MANEELTISPTQVSTTMADEAPTITTASAQAAAAAKRAEFELADGSGGGVEAVRAASERALAALPDQATEHKVYWRWFLAEQRAGDVDGQRRVLERWVHRLPQGGGGFGGFGMIGWDNYLEFEVGNGEVESVRAVGEGLIAAFPVHPGAYMLYVRALAALSRHVEAFAVAERGAKEMTGWCRGHGERLWYFMAKYIRSLKAKQSTSWEDSHSW